MRAFNVALAGAGAILAFSDPAGAQDQDLFIKGRITDAVTGEALAKATVDLFDETDTANTHYTTCDIKGAYSIEAYSWDSSYYVVSFNAPGHVTRRAVIDLTGMNTQVDLEIAWEISMDVALTPEESGKADPAADDLLGFALFDNGAKTIRWRSSPAKERFPIRKFRSERIRSAEEKIGELYDKDGTLLSGVVHDQWTDRAIEGVAVIVTSVGGYHERVISDRFGYYGIVLPYDRVFTIRFAKEDLVNKSIEFNNSGILEEDRITGFRANVDMRLFKPIAGEDFKFLDEPMGKASYDPETRNIAWDMDYTHAMQEKLQAILEKHPKGR
jgi:hypothetical protein